MRLPATTLLLASVASGLSPSSLAGAPVQQRCRVHVPRASPVCLKGNFEGFSLDTLKRSFERIVDLRVARASHILVKGFDDQTLSQMEAWKADIANDPDKFAARAQESSVCPSRVKGGDLGYFTRGKSAPRACPRPPSREALTAAAERCHAQW